MSKTPLLFISRLSPGGAERCVVSLAVALAKRGIGVSICTVSSHYDSRLVEELSEAGVPVTSLGARRLADPRALARFRNLTTGKHDLVHAHGQDASILAVAGRTRPRIPLLMTRHVMDEPAHDWRRALRRRLALAAARRVDQIVAVSPAVAHSLATQLDVPLEEIEVIPNGIDLARFEVSGSADSRRLRESIGVEADAPLVLMVGVLREGKGHELLLRSLPPLRELVPGTRIAIAGDGPLREDLRSRAVEEEGVVLLGHRSDVPDLLAACDLLVLPSESEALPTVLIEAAAAGRPVVATDVGGISEVVTHGQTGLLVPPADPAALAGAIGRILLDPGRAQQMGRAAMRRAGRFSMDTHVAAILDLWEKTGRRLAASSALESRP